MFKTALRNHIDLTNIADNKMGIDDYRKGVKEVIADEELLDNAIMTDLFYLGQSLGKKYELLRKCYTIFMIGLTF